MEKVTLEYRREFVGETTSGLKNRVVGRVIFEPEDGAEEEQPFDTQSFAEMMGMYAGVLKEHPKAKAFFQRKDRPNTAVMDLDPLTVEGLRERTEETIEALTNPPPVHIDMRNRIRGESAIEEETER